MPAFREEIFGPVMATAAFDELDEAIALANQTPYRLAPHLLEGAWSSNRTASSASR